jgi:hypothetical protein
LSIYEIGSETGDISRRFGEKAKTFSFTYMRNDPPKRVIGLALASILNLKISVLVFPGWEDCGRA